MAIDIGRIAYQAWKDSIDEQEWSIRLLKNWEDIGQVEQNAWRASAVAVLNHIDDERERMAQEDAFERDLIID